MCTLEVTGNFPTVTRVLLSKIPAVDGRMTYVYDEYVVSAYCLKFENFILYAHVHISNYITLLILRSHITHYTNNSFIT